MGPIEQPRPMTPRPFRIETVKQETSNVFTWTLRAQKEGDTLAFQPGQFTMLYLFGVGEVPISISGDAEASGDLIHTIRAAGTVTQAMQQKQAGDLVGVRGPFGNAWPIEEAEGCDVVLAVGGLGLAPMRPTLYHILRHRERYKRVYLLYGARTPSDILYPEELRAWSDSGKIDVRITVDVGMDGWTGEVGLVTDLIRDIQLDPYHCVSMICGPEIMMHFTARALFHRRIAPQHIHVSMERSMRCATGWCGHCQLGPKFICKDGPVFDYPTIQAWLHKRER
ncbi:MAG: FAD/NAD(P)-binding protein [Myxococcales bacterium]|nr:FAD/NAD(P)-binding protein [Myxococcales bacterium]MCB9641953.1 FAD/NAD(P)-binding protein [Myxococcales bacterium]